MRINKLKLLLILKMDIDGFYLFLELNILKIYRFGKNKPIDNLNYIKRIDFFSDTYIADRIMLISIILGSLSKKSLSKLKIIKTL